MQAEGPLSIDNAQKVIRETVMSEPTTRQDIRPRGGGG